MCIKTYTRHSCCDRLSRAGTIRLCSDFIDNGTCQAGLSHWDGEYSDTVCHVCAVSWSPDLTVEQDLSTPIRQKDDHNGSQHIHSGKDVGQNGDVSHFDIGSGGDLPAPSNDPPVPDVAEDDAEEDKNVEYSESDDSVRGRVKRWLEKLRNEKPQSQGEVSPPESPEAEYTDSD